MAGGVRNLTAEETLLLLQAKENLKQNARRICGKLKVFQDKCINDNKQQKSHHNAGTIYEPFTLYSGHHRCPSSKHVRLIDAFFNGFYFSLHQFAPRTIV